MKNVFEILQPPFKYDDFGQMIFDKDNNLCLDVRAWGLLQYEKDAEALQDSFGEAVAEALNEIAKKRLEEK